MSCYTRKKLQDAAVATGDGTAFDAVAPTAVRDTVCLQITGTFVGTVTFEATVDGSNWVAVLGTNVNAGTTATTATAPGIFRFDVNGFHQLRARVSAYTSGSITVTALGVDL